VARGRLPKLSDHTLSSDFSQYNHLFIATASKFAIVTTHDHDEIFLSYTELPKITSQTDLCRSGRDGRDGRDGVMIVFARLPEMPGGGIFLG
jgi:hypothetical protein